MNQKIGKKMTLGVIVFIAATAATVVSTNLKPELKVITGYRLKNGVVDKKFSTKTTDGSRHLDSTMLYIEQHVGSDTVSQVVPLNHLVDSTVLSVDTLIKVSYATQ